MPLNSTKGNTRFVTSFACGAKSVRSSLTSVLSWLLPSNKSPLLVYLYSPAPWCNTPSGPEPHYRGFTVTLRHTTLRRTTLDERSARRAELYMTKHNTRKRQTSVPPAGFKPAIPAGERPQTDALDRAASGIGPICAYQMFLG